MGPSEELRDVEQCIRQAASDKLLVLVWDPEASGYTITGPQEYARETFFWALLKGFGRYVLLGQVCAAGGKKLHGIFSIYLNCAPTRKPAFLSLAPALKRQDKHKGSCVPIPQRSLGQGGVGSPIRPVPIGIGVVESLPRFSLDL